MNARLSSALVLVALIAAPGLAFAQANVPSTAESSRVQSQIAPIKPLTAPEDKAKVNTARPASAPAGSEKVKFVLKSVHIDGVTAYDQASLSSLYKGMIGKTISLSDVYGLADRLTAKYRNEGYLLTQVVVPPQTIESGNIRLRTVEGFVENVSIQGAQGKNAGYLKDFAERIRTAKPLNAKALERYLLLMNDLAGVSARAVLSPSKTAGASDITIVVEEKPVDLFFQVDNRGSRYLGPIQFNAGTRLNNAFGFHEGISLQAVTAPDHWPERELDYGSVTWSQPLNHEGTKLNLGAGITSTEPGFDLTPFAVKGIARTLNAELSHPFIRSRQQNLYGSLKFNLLNTEREDNLGLGKTTDRIRVLRGGGTYQFTDGLLGINTISAEASQGLDILKMKDKGLGNPTRALGDPEFFKGTLELSRVQRLTDTFELFWAASGQKSANVLLASEEFGVGGANFGSAYDSSEITGEDGLATRLELRANDANVPGIAFSQIYGFYDIGKVWDRDNAVAKEKRRSIASTGVGMRTSFNDNVSGTVEIAVPLTREVQTQGDNNPRFFGSLTAKF